MVNIVIPMAGLDHDLLTQVMKTLSRSLMCLVSQ